MKEYSDCTSQSITLLNGVGIKTKQLLSQLGVETLFDLLSMVPADLVDKSDTKNITNLENGDFLVISGEILKTTRTSNFKPNYILTIQSDVGPVTVRFIHKIIIFMNLKKGMRIRASGNVIKKSRKLEIILDTSACQAVGSISVDNPSVFLCSDSADVPYNLQRIGLKNKLNIL